MEMLIIIAVICIFGAIAAPSFATMLDGMAIKKTVTNIQGAIQDTQRQAVRSSRVCNVRISNVNVDLASSATHPPSLSGTCLTSGTPALDSKIRLASNIQPLTLSSSSASSQPIEVRYGSRGGAEFSVLSAVLAPQLPNDPTGKIVAATSNAAVPRQCVALSNILGLARVGVYTGGMDPKDITDTGICTAMDWTKQ
jgi:Tfp pilus assembly protein FimT